MSCESVGISERSLPSCPFRQAADELDEVLRAHLGSLLGGCGPGLHAAGARQEEGTLSYGACRDRHSEKRSCCVCRDESGGKLTRPLPFKNNEAGFEKLLAWLEGIVQDPSEAFVGMEATGHYWMACFSFLTSAGYACCVVNPMQVRAVRELKSMPRVKNDRVDSWLIRRDAQDGQLRADAPCR